MKNIKHILVIFKTHLDIGFTDTSENIKNKYIHEYLPNAIKIGYELRNTNRKFVWTTGSWLIYEALKEDKGSLASAIEDGIISWHALPFTTHTEIMSTELFTYGLSLSKELDQKFGKKTIAGKMTDVPGHTIGIVPILETHGVEMLHIGVNPATPVPAVPEIFKWKCEDKSIIVIYQGDYGQRLQIEDTLVVFAHTGDNIGPQSAQEVINIYNELEKEYPGCDIQAGTLNDLAQKVKQLQNLPIIENEIGDTWIHGIQTDPKKISLFLDAQRKISKQAYCGIDLTDSLLMVPEHTWGKDIKKYYSRTDNYLPEKFAQTADDPHKIDIEASWIEQRHFVEDAFEVLRIEPDYPCNPFNLSSFSPCADFRLKSTISWQLFDNNDYNRYKENYMRLTEENSWWALWDFTKYGLPDYKGVTIEATPVECYKSTDSYIARLSFDPAFSEYYGLPELWVRESENQITIKWFGKKESRLPQAFWMKINDLKECWEIHKMDKWISPDNIIGSPLISGTDLGVRNHDVEIRTIDSALVAPFGRHLLEYGIKPAQQDMYFCLYNNIWNTNFPMWYADDAVFRFQIRKRTESK